MIISSSFQLLKLENNCYDHSSLSSTTAVQIYELFHIYFTSEVSFRQEVSGAYTAQFLDTDELKIALRARKVSGSFEKRCPAGY